MLEIVCTSAEVAEMLQDSVQWQLLIKHLERQGVSASIWIEGEDDPAFAQVPEVGLKKGSSKASLRAERH